MIKVHILTTCDHCNGQAYLPLGEAEDYQGRKYIRHIPCTSCEGSGSISKWVSIQEFIVLLTQEQCQHQHSSCRGGFHFSAGDVWDDIQEFCDDCGVNLDRQTLEESISKTT